MGCGGIYIVHVYFISNVIQSVCSSVCANLALVSNNKWCIWFWFPIRCVIIEIIIQCFDAWV